MRKIKVEVVTPVHNRRELTLECLRSLAEIDADGLDIHITIVDDGSTDGTAEALAKDFPYVNVVSGNGNLWYTAGMNCGITAAMERSPDYVLGINNDCSFDVDFLQHLIRLAETRKNAVVGAILVNWDDRESIFQVAPKFKIGWGGMRHWYRQTTHTIPADPWKVELIVGNCVLFPAAAIREAGLMDQARLPQYGDAEYTPRMKRLGWQLLIEPRARVFCKPNDIPGSMRQMSPQRWFSELFRDPYGPHSLKRRWFMNLGCSPNKFAGILAFFVFFARLAIGKNMEGQWGQSQPEPKLSELYADATVSRN